MTAPTRPDGRVNLRIPIRAEDALSDAAPDLSAPRPSLMDRLHFARDDAAELQRTLGNQVARRLATERKAMGDAPADGSTPAKGGKPAQPGKHPDAAAQEGEGPVAPRVVPPGGTPPLQPPAPPSKGATPAPPPPTPAAGVPEVTPPAPGPASTVNDLQSQVSRAASAIPHPATNAFSPAQQAIRAAGFRMALGPSGGGAKKSGGGGGGGRVEDPNRPFEPDPVPKQTKALLDAGKKKLDDIPRLGFQTTPKGHVPVLGSRPISDNDLKTLMLAPNADRKALMDEEDRRRLEDRKAKREKETADEKDPKKKAERMAAKPGDDEPKTFAEMRELLVATPKPADLKENAKKKKEKDKDVDDSVPKYKEPEPPGPIVFGADKKEKLGQVLAGLKAEPDVTAKQILTGIRRTVVSKTLIGPTLDEVLPTIGESHLGKVQQAFLDKVADLQKGAGITDDELAKRVEERKTELARIRAAAAQGTTQAQADADRVVRDKAKKEAAEAAAKKEAADKKHGVVKKAAPKIKLAMDVDSRRTRLIGYVTKDVADMVVKVKQKGEIRDMTVARMARDYIDAYRFAAQQDTYQTNATATDQKSAATGEADQATRDWLDTVTKSVESFKTDQKKTDDGNVAKLQELVRTAGDAKSEAIRAWAEKTSGKKRTEEQKAADRAADAADRQKAEAAALDQLEKSRVSLGVISDFDEVDKIAAEVQAGHDRETIIANLHLNSVETAILDAYMNPPEPGDDRALSGVMAGVRMRLQMSLQPEIAPEIEKMILDEHSEDGDALDRIGGAQTPGFSANTIAQTVHAALDKMDTDEDAVYDALANLTKIQAQAIRIAYKTTYPGSTIEGDMKGGVIYGMSGNELKRAQKLLEADQKAADAIGYRIALKGNEGAWYHMDVGSGDSEALDKINHGKSLEERQAAEDEYNAENDETLKAQLAAAKTDDERRSILKSYRDSGKSRLVDDANASLATDRQKERFKFSVAGDDDSADALELRDHLPTPADLREAQAQPRDESGIDPQDFVVADRKKVEAIYDRIRREATDKGDREHWTSAQIEAEIARRTKKIEGIFNSKFSKDYEVAGDASALRAAFDLGFRKQDDEKNLANALADNDTKRIDAAKIHVEHRGVYADDDVENAILQAQYQRALADTRRDEMPLRKVVMARQMVDLEKDTRSKARKAAKDRGETDEQADQEAAAAWDGKKQWAVREKMQRDIDRTLETAAAGQAKGNMNALRDAYKKDYGENLDDVVKSDTSGYSGQKAMALLAQNGQLTLGQTMFYAVRGIGTDEDALNALKGHTKAEIDVARKEFKKLAEDDAKTPRGILNSLFDSPDEDHTDMDTEIMDDVSGRTGFDVSQMLKGEPETIDEKRQRLLEAVDWEKQAGPLGQVGMLGGDQATALDTDLARLDKTIKKLEDPKLSAEQRDMYLGFFDQDVATVDAGIKAHREMLDTWTDRITTAVGLVVGIAVTILTFGAAGPVLAAVLGSVLATAATMSLKAAIKGAAYGWEDIATDLAIGVVDALAAGLTAGLGGKLLGAAEAAAPEASQFAFGRAIQQSLRAGGRLAVINPAESVLARAIPTSTVLKEMVERGGLSKVLALTLAHGGEMVVATTPSALAGSILDENNYKEGNPIGNILSGTIHQVGTGAIMGLGMHVGMHVGGSALEFGGRLFDAMKTPEAPALHNFELAQKEFPGITYEDFTKLRAAATMEIQMREREVSEHPTSGEDAPHEGTREGGTDATSGERSTDRLPLPDESIPNAAVGAERPAEMGAPGPNNPDVVKANDVTTPRDLTEAHVNELLPPSLKDKLTVTIDPHEAPGTVKVERVMRLGVVVDVKLVVGPKVRPIDIMLHSQTVHAMKRYVGVTGTIVRAIERMRSFIVRDGVPAFGTKAWESWHELNKLPAIIEQRLEMLRGGGIDAHSEAAIHADLEHIAREIDKHRATLDAMDRSPGSGSIALPGQKPPDPVSSRPTPRERRGDPGIERFLAEHSALQKKYPDAQFVTVGPPWVEVKPEGARTYRYIEVRDPETERVLIGREEIQSLGPNNEPLDRWVQRGSEGNITGAIGEEGFRAQFEAEKAAGLRENEHLLPADLMQRAGGQGFDGVIVKFDEKGRATIVLVEVKNYPGRYIPLADITAISENLMQNLKLLQSTLRDPGKAKALGLSLEQMRAADQAIKQKRLEFQLLRGDTTKLGPVESGRSSVLKNLRVDISDELGVQIPQDKVTSSAISDAHMRSAEAFMKARERLGGAEELRELAKGKDATITEPGVRRAEAALTAEKTSPGLIDPPLGVGDEPRTFVDSKGNPFAVIAVPEGAVPSKVATDVAGTLRAKASKPGKRARVIIDVTEMTPAQRQTLRRSLQTLANKAPKLDLGRIVVVDVARGTSTPFTGLPK